MTAPPIWLYDTTLRDGSQGEGVNFSCEDKLRISRKLDELGIHYIEGGWPGSNPKDIEYYERARRELHLRQARVVAFGSTVKAHTDPADDAQMRLLVDAQTPVICIFGKTWDLHVTEVLRTTLDENLRMIGASTAYLKSHTGEFIYDAEHFFDGYKANPDYALATLKAAADNGADALVLCDTNGGSMYWEVGEIVRTVKAHLERTGYRGALGIHTHNDGDVGVANALEAIRAGANHVQGTINGYGERCGNSNLNSIIANLKLKMGVNALSDAQLARLNEVSHFVAELANLQLPTHMAFVGRSAFAHKGGTHVNAVVKLERSYQHIDPTLVGNQKRIVVSELAGKDNIAVKREEFGLEGLNKEQERRVLERIKELENQGFAFEGAEGSVALLLRRLQPDYRPPFELLRYKVVVEHMNGKTHNGFAQASDGAGGLAGVNGGYDPTAWFVEATVKVRVGGQIFHTAAEGNGPVNALDLALRKAITQFFPDLAHVSLVDYKVRILDSHSATGAIVRVLIESTDGHNTWSTVGASSNIIEASWQALADGVEYALLGMNRTGAAPVSEPRQDRLPAAQALALGDGQVAGLGKVDLHQAA
ncbi:MAG: citramalate synthase [Anaerolinea sp.]|nr:citramalate synthase [Anaerolinea sp.]